MSDISEILSALKRGGMTIEDIIAELAETLKSSKVNLEGLIQPLQELQEIERKQSTEIANFESNNLTLSQEITSLKEEKSKNEDVLRETQEKFTEKTNDRTKLESRKRELTSELSAIEKNLEAAKKELETETETNQKLQAEIKNIVETTEQKINEIEQQAEKERDVIRKSKGERMALEFLIKKNYIEFNEIKIINALEGRKNTDLSTIAKVTGLSTDLIVSTLNGLMKRNLLTFDNSSGAITLTGSLKI
ncbi:MAG: hypothetical protein ACTSXO_05805 [Candidatus Heimdallarchaeota archaeon]|nr:MAG: hypothetical protein DRP02_09830 [Candidatus Gerdarchaeota archaeon]